MKRLTFNGNFCDIAMCREEPCKYRGGCTARAVWERLKEFEDAEEQGLLVKLPCKVGDMTCSNNDIERYIFLSEETAEAAAEAALKEEEAGSGTD